MPAFVPYKLARNGLQRRYSRLRNGPPPAKMISVLSHFMCSLVYEPLNEKSVPKYLNRASGRFCPDSRLQFLSGLALDSLNFREFVRTEEGQNFRPNPRPWENQDFNAPDSDPMLRDSDMPHRDILYQRGLARCSLGGGV